MAKDNFNTFSTNKTWQDKILEGDKLWSQVQKILGKTPLPQTPRRPDVRMIINNISDKAFTFKNPGDHSGSREENIPGNTEKSAVMVMLKGETLEEQYKNAETLYNRFKLADHGLTNEFVKEMNAGRLSFLLDEAYGPAPFQGQTDKLENVIWTKENHSQSIITPQKGSAASFGARAATNETVFLAKFHIFVKGTNTTSELAETDGMCIAVSEDWQTKKISTRPIVPSVAKVYYGMHYDDIPMTVVHPNGLIKEVLIKKTPPLKKTASPKR